MASGAQFHLVAGADKREHLEYPRQAGHPGIGFLFELVGLFLYRGQHGEAGNDRTLMAGLFHISAG